MRNSFFFFYLITLILVVIWLIILGSWMGSVWGLPIQNLLAPESIRWMLKNFNSNFHNVQIASILILLVGVGVMKSSGMIKAFGDFYNHSISIKQKRSLLVSLFIGISYLSLVMIATLSPWAILMNISGKFENSAFMVGMIPIISLFFLLIGGSFGIASGKYLSVKEGIYDVEQTVVKAVPYLLFLLVASQFMALFHYSKLDLYLGIGKNLNTFIKILLYYFPLITLWASERKE